MKKLKSLGKLKVSLCFKKIMIFLLAFILLFNILFKIGPSKSLIISHQKTGKVFLDINVNEKDTVKFLWIHSFEHIPWTEEFEILENNHLLLHKITVAGYGAGIPENKGTVTIEDGIISMSNIEEDFDGIHWINSNTALVNIALNDKEIIKGSELPHHEPLDLIVKERLSVWLRFR